MGPGPPPKVRRMRDVATAGPMEKGKGKGKGKGGKDGGKDANAKQREAEMLATARKLRVTKLVPVVNEEDLLRIFKPFGEVEHVKMEKDTLGRCDHLSFKGEFNRSIFS